MNGGGGGGGGGVAALPSPPPSHAGSGADINPLHILGSPN